VPFVTRFKGSAAGGRNRYTDLAGHGEVVCLAEVAGRGKVGEACEWVFGEGDFAGVGRKMLKGWKLVRQEDRRFGTSGLF